MSAYDDISYSSMKENTCRLRIRLLAQVICVNLLLSESISSILEKYISPSHASSVPTALRYSESPKSSNSTFTMTSSNIKLSDVMEKVQAATVALH